jgi:hypothetical protein
MSAQQPADQGFSLSGPTEPGTPVRVRFRKWDGTPHWVFDSTHLGSDEHGAWLGYPARTLHSRPGLRYHAKSPGVVLVGDFGWVPSFNGHPHETAVYIDLATVPEWRYDGGRTRRTPAWEATSADLDLDVIALRDEPRHDSARRQFFIDDEDEFAEHTVRYGYPPDLVARVRADADALLTAVRAGEPPYDGATAKRWLAALDTLSAR